MQHCISHTITENADLIKISHAFTMRLKKTCLPCVKHVVEAYVLRMFIYMRLSKTCVDHTLTMRKTCGS